jgi:hypothetical protein
MNTHTSDAVQGQRANEADDGDYDEFDGYDRLVPVSLDGVLQRCRAKKQAELDKIKARTPGRRRFLNAIRRLTPTDLPWACELMACLKEEVSSIERSAAR